MFLQPGGEGREQLGLWAEALQPQSSASISRAAVQRGWCSAGYWKLQWGHFVSSAPGASLLCSGVTACALRPWNEDAPLLPCLLRWGTEWSKVLSTALLSSLCSWRGLGRPSPPSGFTLFRTQKKLFDGRKESLESWLLLLAGCIHPLGFCESCKWSHSGWWCLGTVGSEVER